jgi:putative transposase
MRTTFKYRLYPTTQQQCLLERQLEECRWLYNQLLAERRDAWEQRQESLRLYDQHATLPALNAERPQLAGVQSQVLQNVAVRIDLAFKAFFRRCAAGEKRRATRAFAAKDATTASPSPRCRSAASWTWMRSACA